MSNFIKSRRFMALTLAVGAVTAAILANPAVAAPTATTAGNTDLTPQELAEQNSPAYALAHQIVGNSGYTANDDSSGYARVEYNVTANSVDLWWKGSLSQAVQSMVDTARGGGVEVTIHPASHTRYFMTIKSGLLINNPKMQSQGIDVQYVTMPDDMSGFDITVSKSARTFSETQSETGQIGASITGIPVHSVTETSEPAAVTASRAADTAPWKGGGELISTEIDSAGDRHYCTTGFAVTDNGKDALLSAAHCDTNVSSPALGWYNGNYTTLAHHTDTKTTPTLDALILDTVGSTNATIYTGDISSSSTTPVAGSEGNVKGDWIRTSGANSGSHYSIQVTDVDQTRSCEFNTDQHTNYTCYYGAFASQPTGTPGNPSNIVDAEGDSGGPVYTTVNAPSGKVTAKGIIDAEFLGIYQIQNCDTVETLAYPAGTGTLCSTKFIYQEITPILNIAGVNLKTQ